jgi:hypothetical protein
MPPSPLLPFVPVPFVPTTSSDPIEDNLLRRREDTRALHFIHPHARRVPQVRPHLLKLGAESNRYDYFPVFLFLDDGYFFLADFSH